MVAPAGHRVEQRGSRDREADAMPPIGRIHPTSESHPVQLGQEQREGRHPTSHQRGGVPASRSGTHEGPNRKTTSSVRPREVGRADAAVEDGRADATRTAPDKHPSSHIPLTVPAASPQLRARSIEDSSVDGQSLPPIDSVRKTLLCSSDTARQRGGSALKCRLAACVRATEDTTGIDSCEQRLEGTGDTSHVADEPIRVFPLDTAQRRSRRRECILSGHADGDGTVPVTTTTMSRCTNRQNLDDSIVSGVGTAGPGEDGSKPCGSSDS